MTKQLDKPEQAVLFHSTLILLVFLYNTSHFNV